MRKVVFRRIAEAELDAAVAWYEEKSQGLGDRFGRAVQKLLRRIVTTPQIFAFIREDARRATVRGFPFSVIFREADDQVVVLSVSHTSRDPKIWMDRIDEEFRERA
jgi:plasmid stabilization system protein ParE